MKGAPKDRPYILLNMSLSADGKIASANRQLNHFSSRRDHDHLYELRATVDAVMNGARTVDTAPIRMDPGPKKFRQHRIRNGLAEFNSRIVVTGNGTLDPEAEIFRHAFSPIILLTSNRCPKKDLARLKAVADDVIVGGQKTVDLPAAMKCLRRGWKIRRLLCEGGGALNDALFRDDLIDEIHLTVCPLVIGGSNAPTISDGIGMDRLSDARQFRMTKRKQTDGELFLTYHRNR